MTSVAFHVGKTHLILHRGDVIVPDATLVSILTEDDTIK